MKKIQELINEWVSERDQKAWELVKEQGYSLQQAADELGATKSQVQHIIRKLEEKVKHKK